MGLAADEYGSLLDAVTTRRRRVGRERAVLVALTGIDASGKGHVAARLSASLASSGLRVANLNVDGWLDLPRVRFSASNPARHFYQHAIRVDPLFGQLVCPLRAHRSVDITMKFADETAVEYSRRRCHLSNIDVIVLEGIFLLKRDLQHYYDLACWIECTFETALERAVARAQEGLSPEDTTHAYRTIYFPAQQIHLRRDSPTRRLPRLTSSS